MRGRYTLALPDLSSLRPGFSLALRLGAAGLKAASQQSTTPREQRNEDIYGVWGLRPQDSPLNPTPTPLTKKPNSPPATVAPPVAPPG